jgi:RNA polymerase sigma-70 factor (ECF subfamily)
MQRAFDPVPDDDGDEADGAFIERLRALDQQAWAELYDGHHAQIWRYVYGRSGSRDAADDVAAQVFTEALSAIHRYRYRGRPVLAWLYRIARNLAAKQVRQERRAAPGDYVEPSGSPEEQIVDAIVLTNAVQRLTGDQREVVVLRFYAGYSTREIALAMGKRESAVYSLEVRAIAALRRQFGQEAEGSLLQADENRPLRGVDRVK